MVVIAVEIIGEVIVSKAVVMVNTKDHKDITVEADMVVVDLEEADMVEADMVEADMVVVVVVDITVVTMMENMIITMDMVATVEKAEIMDTVEAIINRRSLKENKNEKRVPSKECIC